LWLKVIRWFPYRRWPLVIIVNLPGPIAFWAAVLAITDPLPAITMRTNLHCRLLLVRPHKPVATPATVLGLPEPPCRQDGLVFPVG
jgi:hypothetical protein